MYTKPRAKELQAELLLILLLARVKMFALEVSNLLSSTTKDGMVNREGRS